MHTIDLVLLCGGLVATLAVAAMCGLVFVVWLGGAHPTPASEAWRPADEP